MEKFGIRIKLLLGIGVLASGYLVFLCMVQWATGATRQHLETLSQSVYPAAMTLQSARTDFETMNKDYKDSVVLQDKNALAAAAHDAQLVEQGLVEVEQKTAYDPAIHTSAGSAVEAFRTLADRSQRVYRAMVEQTASADASSAASSDGSGVASVVRDTKAMEATLAELNEAVSTRSVASQIDAVERSNSRQRLLAIGLFVLAACFASGIHFMMERQVSAPLRDLAERLGEGARQVSVSARQVSGSGESLAQGASQQAASLEETSASSEEISSMARRSADDCQSTAQLVGMSQQTFAETNRSLKELLSAMDDINTSSGKVSKIIKIIDEIAFQTNILALNAAVEAARAGEAGAGFAVVADEVRGLAQRCAKAAQDSSGIVEESIQRTQLGKKRLDEVAASLDKVTTQSVKVKTFVDQINLASTEQTRGIGQIAKSISSMEKVTQMSAATAEESAAAAQELTRQSDLMNEIVQSLTMVVEGAAA